MKGEGDRKDSDSLHFEDGHTRKQLRNSRKCQCPFVAPCCNVTKYKTLWDKSFQANNPGFMKRIRVRSTLTPSSLERSAELSFLRK